MRYIYLYLSTFIVCVCLSGCKPSKHLASTNKIDVTAEDFNYLKNYNNNDAFNALVLKEITNIGLIELGEIPWDNRELSIFYLANSAWETVYEDKVLFLKDSINGESISVIDYFNPQNVRRDLMKKCEMWLYSQDKKGSIRKRRIKKTEITYERLNNSICRIQLNMRENMAGKILVRKYNLTSPYSLEAPYDRNRSQDIKSWIFQKDVPVLHGLFEICMSPKAGEVVKIGNGEMDIKRKEINEYSTYFISNVVPGLSDNGVSFDKRTAHMTQNKADLVTVSVSNVMPLPKGSNAQPLGIKVVFSDKVR